MRELQIQKEKKKAVEELANRKTRKIEEENQELLEKLREDEEQMREKAELLQKLKQENDKADRVIRDLARQSDMNQNELERIKDEIEIERRRTLAQEEGYNRKLKSLEEQKKKLEERIKAEGDKSLNYEAMIRKINDEREDERRKTMMDN